ncbi:hypothetical protein CN884_14045 [Ochrobactrum sp. 30A/1000/2015]|nr:hypothetical protein CN884_14045 [Ochrobactrum sp. 30A/1000/2015]PJT39874.1 hypothetical protein CN883_08575 [Ochrobactrum sp. 27A/999/2015]PJT44167.1 hypothetical protein CN882_09750 [Ochrobactrum sp. 23A/997/2015]
MSMKPTHAQGIQVAWFPLQASTTAADSIFHSIFLRQPDNFSVNKIPGPAMPFQSQARGLFDGLVHMVNVEPGKTTLIVVPDSSLQNNPEPQTALPITEFGPLWQRLEHILNHLREDILTPSVRAAIIVGAAYMAKDREEANSIFGELTGIHSRPDTEDLIFQKNERLVTKDATFNRVENYSVSFLELVQAQPLWSTAGVTQQLNNRTVQNFFTLANLDFNTVPTGHIYDYRQLVDQYRILMAELLERVGGGNG